jgi:hypothetical protein
MMITYQTRMGAASLAATTSGCPPCAHWRRLSACAGPPTIPVYPNPRLNQAPVHSQSAKRLTADAVFGCRISLAFGWLGFTDLACLFLPISHNSFLNALTGLPYSALIRYHRCVELGCGNAMLQCNWVGSRLVAMQLLVPSTATRGAVPLTTWYSLILTMCVGNQTTVGLPLLASIK